MSDEIKTEEVKEESSIEENRISTLTKAVLHVLTEEEEEKKDLDIFEKAFGKAPEVGYDFRHVDVGIYWRAVVIRWSAAGIGFGEVALIIEDKKIKIDTEYMSKDFCDALIAEAIKKIKEEEAKEPPLTEEEQNCGREPSLKMRADFLQTLYDNADWETEVNPYVPTEDEEETEEENNEVTL